MNKRIITIAAAGTALSLCAAVPVPQVSDVSMSQKADGEAIINYRLSAANAVITLDIQTNATGAAWATIGGKAVSGAQGDVWKVVETGSHEIKWNATTCWADHQIPARGIRAVVTAWALDNTPDYMAVDVSAGAQQNTQTYYPAADFVPGGATNDLYKTTMLLMRKIMAKDVRWTMGSTTLEPGTVYPTHQVTLTNNYYIGVYLITQTQWDLIQPSRLAPSAYINPEYRAMRPVDEVCYNELRNNDGTSKAADTSYDWPNPPNPNSFLGKLRARTGLDFDLPSEAQWEFACRAGNGDTKWGDGSTVRVGTGSLDENMEKLGRYKYNGGMVWNGTEYGNPDWTTCGADQGTAIVGSYDPNDWGIYDMHGNLIEWCLDWYENSNAISAHEGMVNINPSSPQETLSNTPGTYRMMRGGGWGSEPGDCRSAKRHYFKPDLRNGQFGVRVVCTAGLR